MDKVIIKRKVGDKTEELELNSLASQTANGLMSAADKKKLDGIAAGATVGDANAVKKSGDTMTGDLTIQKTNGRFNFINPVGDSTIGSKVQSYNAVCFYDKNNKVIGLLDCAINASNNYVVTGIKVCNGTVQGALNFFAYDDGLIYATVPTQPDDKVGSTSLMNRTNSDNRYILKNNGIANGYLQIVNNGIPGLYFFNKSYDPDTWTNYSNSIHYIAVLRDANNKEFGYILTKQQASGAKQLIFDLYMGDVHRILVFSVDKDTYQPYLTISNSPPAADNSNAMATTYWVRQRIAAATGKAATAFSLGAETASLMSLGNKSGINAEVLETALSCVKEEASQRIFFGFDYELDGESWFFTYDLFDQQNFSENAILAGSGETVSVFARDCGGYLAELQMEPEKYLELYKYAVQEHKQAIMRESLQRKEQIRNAESEEAIRSLLDGWGLLELYEEKRKAAARIDDVQHQDIEEPELLPEEI